MHTTTGKRRPSLCLHPKGIAAFNGKEEGKVTLCDLRGEKHTEAEFSTHKNPVMTIAVSPTGSMVASASEKGTVMKLYKTPLSGENPSFEFVRELRRGKKFADIYSIAFSPDSSLVSLISSTGTIHVFYTSFCYVSNEYGSKTLNLSASNFINMTFLDNETVCLFFHEDGTLRTSSIKSLADLNTNSISLLSI